MSAEVPTNALLEHLPPVDKAPILQKLAEVGLEKFQSEYLIEPPVDEDGLIDHNLLVETMRSLVDADYRWQAPFFDEHHLYWYAALYAAPRHPKPELAREFRNLPINKLWVPRQFHNFIHTVTKVPQVPDIEIMRREIKDFRRRSYLFRVATRAVTIQERMDRSEPFVTQEGEIVLVDRQTRRTYHNPDAMEERRRSFVRQIVNQYKRGLIDLSDLAPVDVIDTETVEAALPEVVSIVMDKPLINTKNHKALKVELPVEQTA